MTAKPHSVLPSPLQTAKLLAAEFALSAVERDERGGTPKAERDALRQSGLLALSIPTQYGGLGARWSDTLGIVREFAKVDSSIAHVFGFHHLMLATVRVSSGLRALPQNQFLRAVCSNQGCHWSGRENRRTVASIR